MHPLQDVDVYLLELLQTMMFSSPLLDRIVSPHAQAQAQDKLTTASVLDPLKRP